MHAMGLCPRGSRIQYPQRLFSVQEARMMNKMQKKAFLPATNSAPMPGNSPLGSLESRAAARMLAAKREGAKKRIEFVTNVARFTWVGDDPMPEDWGSQPRATQWNDCGNV